MGSHQDGGMGANGRSGNRPTYNAFLSYSHTADAELASALQRGLHQFARSPFQLRALHIFRDTTSLSASPALWEAIENALADSQYFILIASPDSAKSKWVARELAYWCKHRESKKILIGVTEGEMVWNETTQDFDWDKTTALPGLLRGMFPQEPLWVDFRWSRKAGGHIRNHPSFRECLATLGARIHGLPKDELIGEDVRQIRRMRGYRGAAIAVLAVLAAIAVLGWYVARRNAEDSRRNAAEATVARDRTALERDRALRSESRHLAVAALRQLEQHETDLAALLALEALPGADRPRPYVPEAEAALFQAITFIGARRVTALEGHQAPGGPANRAAFSPDGTRLITASDDGTARVWDARTGKQLLVLRHPNRLWFAGFDHRGTEIITAAFDGALRLWNPITGIPGRVLRGHEKGIVCVALGPRGLAATASADATAKIWDTEAGTEIATLRGHSILVTSVQISPDGSRVATAGIEGTARLWELKSGRLIAVFEKVPRRSSTSGESVVAKFSPDSRMIVTNHEDNNLRIWSAVDGSALTVVSGHSGRVTSAAFNSTGQLLATASVDGTVRTWSLGDLRTAPVQRLLIEVTKGPRQSSMEGGVNQVAFSPDGAFLATVPSIDEGRDGVQLWNASTGQAITELSTGGTPLDIAIAPDSRHIVTLALHEIALWEMASPSFGRSWHESGPVGAVAVSETGNRLIAAIGRVVKTWEADTGKLLATTTAHADAILSVTFDANGKRFLTTSRDGTARIWDSQSGKPGVVLTGHGKPVLDGTFSPAGDRVATASEDRTARLWDVAGNQTALLSGHEGPVHRVAFSRDGQRIITASADGTARVWEVRSGHQVSILRAHAHGVRAVALNTSGEIAITSASGADSTVGLWEVATGRRLRVLQEPSSRVTGSVMGAAFSPDGKYALTWGFDGSARLWNAGRNYALEAGFRGGCPVVAAAFNPDGTRIVAVSKDSSISAWDVSSGVRLLTLYGLPDPPGRPPLCDIGAGVLSRGVESVGFGASLGTVAGYTLDDRVFFLTFPAGPQETVRLARRLVPRELTPEERSYFYIER